MSYTDSLIIAYCCLSALLYLLEVSVLDVVIGVAALRLLSALEALAAGLLASGLSTTGLLVHLGTGGLHHLVEVVDGSVDGIHVAALVGVLQLLHGLLNAGFVGTELVAVLLQEGLGLEDH